MSSLLHRAAIREPGDGGLTVLELDDADRPDLVALVAKDPIVNSVLDSRLNALPSLVADEFGGPVLGVRTATGQLAAAVFCGGILLPVGGDPAAWRALGAAVVRRPRTCSSIVGRDVAVQAIWQTVQPHWPAARAVRTVQPLLVLDRVSPGAPRDPRVRAAVPADLDGYLPAAIAMFTEELEISPLGGADGAGYRDRVADLIDGGRAFVVADRDGSTLFKADFGAICPHTCQVQGVWVRPEQRGAGIGTAALASVFDYALQVAPTVSLYVNDFNVAARRMYARLGMRQVATLATVLL